MASIESADCECPLKSRRKAEFGDFQTPPALAVEVCACLRRSSITPRSIVEPTCGVGAILIAALAEFPHVDAGIGLEINPAHLRAAETAASASIDCHALQLRQADFFDVRWQTELADLTEPLLVIGNPPWVTSSALSVLESENLPAKSNRQRLKGIDALTGKSNFDISEWMLLRLGEALCGRRGTLAMLCKTAVARKVLQTAWRHAWPISRCEVRRIDAAEWFDAAVAACLLVVEFAPDGTSRSCDDFDSLTAATCERRLGWHDGRLIADWDLYDRWRHLISARADRWRSGVKHDCAPVMEFRREGKRLVNGLGDIVNLELDYLFPLCKSSDLSDEAPRDLSRWVLVPQSSTGESTDHIRDRAPLTWRYLESHGERLDQRRSSIYRKRPRFAVFGVGDYTFAPWKVAISGLYKRLRFHVLGPREGKPVILDDTCYAYPCPSESAARFLRDVLQSRPAQELLSSLTFWDGKRPITAELLGRLDLERLATELGVADEFRRQFGLRSAPQSIRTGRRRQPSLFPQ